jgi:ParB family chromosome partitioning protein
MKEINMGSSMQAALLQKPAESTLPLRDLFVGHYNPRTNLSQESIREMVEVIKPQGINTPILVRRVEGMEKPWEIVAGQRRFHACMLLYGPDFQIPVLVKNFTDAEAEVASLSENVDREDMTPVMEAEGAARVLARANGDRKEAARRLGWSSSKLDDRLKLMSCSSDVRKALDAKVITLGLAEMLSGLTKEKQDEVLAGFAASGKYPTAEECKPQIMAMTKSLNVAIFDKTECGSCPNNSAQQRAMFGNIEEGYCLNAACYDQKIETVLGAKVDRLRETYQRVEIVRPGDNYRVIKLLPEAVGQEQAGACRTCANHGAAVSCLPNSIGRVTESLCWDAVCNAEKVAAHQKALKDAEEAAQAASQANSTDTDPAAPAAQAEEGGKPGGRAKTTSKKPGAKPGAGKTAVTVTLTAGMQSFRDKLYRGVLYKELGVHPERNMHFVIALAYSGHGRYLSGALVHTTLQKAKMIPEGLSAPNDLAEALKFAMGMPADRAAKLLPNLGATAIESLTPQELVSLCALCTPDWSKYFRLDSDEGRTFLGAMTKDMIAAVCEEVGIAAAMGDTFRSIAGGKKDDFIKQVTGVQGFDYNGKIPRVLLPETAK